MPNNQHNRNFYGKIQNYQRIFNLLCSVMKNKGKFSNIEIILRILLFLIFTCSAILKIIVGFDNFEMSLMESGLVDSWIQSVYMANITVIAEISCAVLALFGKFTWFQNAIFTTTFIFYLISISFSFSTTLYQDYTLVFFGFDIYSDKDLYFFGGYYLSVFFMIALISIFILLQKKAKSQLMKWPYQLVLICGLSLSYLALGSINPNQFTIKSEQYQAGITNWSAFNNSINLQHPEFKEGDWTVAFFSTGCDHCKKFARKISFTPGGDKNVLYVFWANESEIAKFKKDNNVNGPHMKLPQHVIMNIAGQEYPVFFSFKDGVPTANYAGSEFTYATIDAIFGN